MIDQAGWGSTKIYADGDLNGGWDPKYIIIHWGGWTEEVSEELEDDQLRGWQRYHLGKGWQDIAYNYGIGESGKLYRLRGENHGGHTSGTDENGESWSSVGIGVVWIGGKSDANGPSKEALQSMADFITERNLPVLGHVQTGKATACPGQFWLDFVEDYNNGEYNVGDAPNLQECLPHQTAAWQKAYDFNNELINEDTHPRAMLSKGDFYTLLERHGLYDEVEAHTHPLEAHEHALIPHAHSGTVEVR